MKARILSCLLFCISLVACAIAPLDERVDETGQALVTSACDPKLVAYGVKPKTTYAVHKMPNASTWHDDNACLKELRDNAKSQPASAAIYDLLYFQTLYVLSNPNVRFYEKGKNVFKKLDEILNKKGVPVLGNLDRVVYWNDKKIAYDSMSHADFGVWLLDIHELLLLKQNTLSDRGRLFRDLGLAVLGVITDSTADGGLRSREDCKSWPGKCSWFHSVTQRDLPKTTAGATLNKSLHPVRELWNAADTLAAVDPKDTTMSHTTRIANLRQASREGALQLVYGKRADGNGRPPNLFDFFPVNANGKPISPSWMYYGFNPENGKPHYLTENDWKNCNYHLHVLELLARILPRLSASERAGFKTPRPELGNLSVVQFMLKSYNDKLDSGGLEVNGTATPPGRFGGCGERSDKPLEPWMISALEGL